jgi:hypothetical protein
MVRFVEACGAFARDRLGLQRSVVPAPDCEMGLIEALSTPDLDAGIQWNLDEGARQRLAKSPWLWTLPRTSKPSDGPSLTPL